MGRTGMFAVIALLSLGAGAADMPLPIDVDLLSKAPGDPSLGAPNREPTALATRAEYPVEFNTRAFASAAGSRGGARLTVELPRGRLRVDQRAFNPEFGFTVDENFDAVVDPKVPDEKLIFYWYGIAEGAEVSLQFRNGVVAGRIDGGADELYVVAHADGRAILRDIDIAQFPKEPSPTAYEIALKSFPTYDADHAGTSVAGAKAQDRIQVLPIYTSSALAVAGSQANLDAMINSIFNESNAATGNSHVLNPVFANASVENRLACEDRSVTPNCCPEDTSVACPALARSTTYSESPTACDTPEPPPLCSTAIGRFSLHKRSAREIAAISGANPPGLRNEFSADLVLLLVGDSSRCGNAYIQIPNCGVFTDELGCNVKTAFNSFGFAVVSTSTCLSGNYTGTHELGHTLGLEHE
jgi:hypothetical protein